MKRFNIRQYVAWLTLAPLLVLAICMESYLLYYRFVLMDEHLLERGELITNQLASSSEYGVFSNNLTFLQNVATAALQEMDVNGVVILDADARVLTSAGQLSTAFRDKFIGVDITNNQSVLELAGGIDKAIILHPANSGAQHLWLYHAIVPVQIALDDAEAKTVIKPTGHVIVEISRSRNEGLKSRTLMVTLLVTTLFLAFALYLVYIASRRITYPISELSEAIQAIGAGKLDTRILLSTDVHELATLVQGLNQTTEQLQQERAVLQQRIGEATLSLREKKEEAERASQDKSRFLAVASHDLRQPLHAIGLFVAELQRKLSGTEQQYLVGQVAQSVEVFSELLNALLDISKLDAGVVIPQTRSFNMDAMLKRIAADYHMLADTKKISLVVRQCNMNVTSDPILLERILINLVSNAIRYTSQNGSVMVACRRRGDFLRIEVRDNGSGISKADQTNIFREFFQLAQPQLDAGKGLGLGLAIVDRLVKLLGHRIELRSAIGKGSTFSLEVPLVLRSGKPYVTAAANVLVDSEAEVLASPLSGKRFLVVDDDAAVLSGTANLLVSWGCRVSAAASLVQVDNLIDNGEEWDFIVSDYQLENDTNGIDVITRVRQHQNQPVPCILVTGDTSPEVLKLANTYGYNLLYKPIRPAKLRSLIMHLLEGHTT